MADSKQPSPPDDASRRANTDQSSPDAARGAGSSNAAGTGDNPQDGKDAGRAGDSRPRGKTEDPEITL